MTTMNANTPQPPSTPMPQSPANPARSERSRAMRRDLAAGVADLHDLAERHKLTRVQLARWAARPRHSAMIDELTRLANKRTSLLLATSRADAASMLRRIILRQEDDAKEVTRKACLDLLKLDRSLSAVPLAPPSIPAPPAGGGERYTEAEMDAAMDAYAQQNDIDRAHAAASSTLEDQDAGTLPTGAD
jgi:hypothetical protein